MPLKACFLLSEIGASGGVAVVTGHARRLAEHGIDAAVVVAGSDEHRGERWDIAIGTWWETAAPLLELDAATRVMFLQSLEERFYGERELAARLGAASVLALPVHFVAVAGWLARALEELRPDARCPVVRPGIDKEIFRLRPAQRRDGPLRVLVEGQPELWFKAVPEAIAAARAAREPVTVTLVAPDPSGAGELGADRVTGGLDPAGMAALYAEHDVVLKLSRVEGLGLAPLEAMHVGLPCVVTPYTGHEEYVRHGENGLVVGFDDLPGTTAALDALARDPALRERLGRGALATAAQWPSPADSTAELATALKELAAAPPADAAGAAALGVRRQRVAIELGRAQLGELQWYEGTIMPELERLRATVIKCVHDLEASQELIRTIRDERAYRMAVRARTLLQKVRP